MIHSYSYFLNPFLQVCKMSNSLSLIDTWVKAAVEHITVKIRYYSGPLKNEITDREIEPDFIIVNDHWRDFGCWGFCRLRSQLRVFNIEGILDWEITDNKFQPNPYGRWIELLDYYQRNDLDKIQPL